MGMLRAIKKRKLFSKKIPLEVARKTAAALVVELQAQSYKVVVVGSVRRRKPIVSDIDILVEEPKSDVIPPLRYVDKFPIITKVVGKYRLPIDMKLVAIKYHGLRCDLLIVKPHFWGMGIIHSTGSTEFNERVFNSHCNGQVFVNKTEQEILRDLQLSRFLNPETRSI